MGSLFSKPKAPAAPKPVKLPEYKAPPAPEPVTIMPSPDDDAVQKKKREEIMRQAKRSGRMSTFLTDDDQGTLG